MYIWDQSSGQLYRALPVASGYAGRGEGKNDPADQARAGVGPIPQGRWRIVSIGDSPNTGPATIVLQPEPGTETFGRSAFRIHGDSRADPGNASHGCIILPRAVRDAIWQSGDRDLLVVA